MRRRIGEHVSFAMVFPRGGELGGGGGGGPGEGQRGGEEEGGGGAKIFVAQVIFLSPAVTPTTTLFHLRAILFSKFISMIFTCAETGERFLD